MTDRELLELAAKAASYPIEVRTEWIEVQILGQGKPEKVAGESHLYLYGELWNPLTDDGDALRLAVKLQMQIDMRDPETHLYVEGCAQRVDQYHKDNNPYTATRRAIVRAAAEIGRGME
ncbi:MAG: hypothetical protein U1D69_12150 [Polynucleobacter sp.]|uniref:hypothetical protein n=1 Tax=Limnobacter sp. TaxID=2003368 RepID=UPI002732A360|nr:hypothetical protein [Limnobacter sp.]MDP3273431.1 hypothetical protein [Limnobacter sp.]MDZ4057689.1 hypothetical protein [Polynucleobacter sp.]